MAEKAGARQAVRLAHHQRAQQRPAIAHLVRVDGLHQSRQLPHQHVTLRRQADAPRQFAVADGAARAGAAN